jgi:short-subunit dehydrogenase
MRTFIKKSMILEGKVFVVTGAGSGMGRELVWQLVAVGARVAAVDLNAATLNETLALLNKKAVNCSSHVLDIADQDGIAQLPQAVIAAHGSVDAIINNAGIIQPFVRVNDLSFEAIHKVMDVNFFGLLAMTKAFLPLLLKRPDAHIINVSSMGGFLPVPGQSVYGASKAAVKLLTEGLYAELRETNVRVSVVFPGAINTNITANSGVHMELPKDMNPKDYKTLDAGKAAQIILEGIERNQLHIYVGSDSKFMNFLYRLAPTFATNFIAKKMKGLLG